MSNSPFCERHGPFNSMYESCPYCAVERGEILRKAKTGPLMQIEDEPSTIGGDGIIAQVQEMQSVPMYDNDPTVIEDDPDLPKGGADELTETDADPGPLLVLMVARPVEERGQVIAIQPGQSIGRRDADIRFDDRKMSRKHAAIERDDEGIRVFDFGTSNGTFVNGERISGSEMLVENDEIRMGQHLFVLKILI